MLRGLPRIFNVSPINASWACPEVVDFVSNFGKNSDFDIDHTNPTGYPFDHSTVKDMGVCTNKGQARHIYSQSFIIFFQ